MYALDGWSDGVIVVTETYADGDDTYNTEERISRRRCQDVLFQPLNVTNLTCVRREYVTIDAVIDLKSIGTHVMVESHDTTTAYNFILEESSCESDITMDSVGSNITITIDPPTCPGWEDPNNLEYEAFLVYSETNNKTVKIAPILSVVNSYQLHGIPYGLYEFIVNATNSCREQCTLARTKFHIPEPTMDVTAQTNSAFHLMSVWISLLPGIYSNKLCKKVRQC
ncbi:hypothetical protein GBAR_LOCUS20911 [Geodia barretti]|uniref:Fibronectin type-III domain-containing protein n=1 Tax=Geodia barretti TaxID=519541 RepID=A0AA35SX99_GEOBA|nr:hypothetical protein GBAR_LOCUS20911 [Geodia barretti]